MQPTLAALLTTLALASARDTGKFMKTVPTISNSLVNLGKMEISFHFNGKHQEPAPTSDYNAHSDYYPQQAVEESCPCNNFKPPFLSDPAEIINKILKSNDLFKDPTSAMCCESAEHMQESSVVFELNPSNLPTYTGPKSPKSPNIQAYPNILRSPMFSPFAPVNPIAVGKPKPVEIFMFPIKKNDMTYDFSTLLKPRKTKEATVVKSDMQIRDGMQKPSVSVKKDLTLLEKKNEAAAEIPREDLHTDAPPVINVSNTL